MSTLDSVSHRFRPGVSLGPRASRRRRRPAVELLEGRQLLASSLTATSVPISPAPVEGQSFTSEVASFTDSDGNKDPGQYVAEINWGNGNSSPGMITAITNPQTGAVTFAVSGTYTFPEEGPSRVSVEIADKDNDTASVQTTNIVSDASLAASAVIVDATQGKALSKVEVAKFTDADPNGKASDFDATINWGDGSSTSNGVVVADRSGGFDVLGSHTYTRSGQFTVKVQINDGGPGVVSPQFYTPSNLISDGAVPADHINANLVNPWGIVATSMSPFWVANN
ncbi:MAG: hypothetical protein JO329_00250, partial [Planctomycetaceae bacterium]|nr:hypothetical protein [Planctomycetaceae bacterium]